MTLPGLPGSHGSEDISGRSGAAPFVLAHAKSEPLALVSPPAVETLALMGKKRGAFGVFWFLAFLFVKSHHSQSRFGVKTGD